MASDLHGQRETRAAASWGRRDSNRGDGDATISVALCWWVGRSGSPHLRAMSAARLLGSKIPMPRSLFTNNPQAYTFHRLDFAGG
jgi:hypothetical protein